MPHNLLAYRSSGLSQQFEWPQLRSLTLKLLFSEPEEIASGIVFLKDFHHPDALRDVTVVVHKDASLSDAKHLAPHANLYEELDYTLIKFTRAQLLWIMRGRFVGRSPFEIDELGPKRFPALSQRGAFRVEVVTDTGPCIEHTRFITNLAISPDSKFVASGSWDGTIILRDIANKPGALVDLQFQWIPHDDQAPRHLAFSPNSRYLLSSAWGRDSCPVVWDLSRGLARADQVLEGHTDSITSCAWSPGGDVIASGSYDTTVRLWDANTFQPLHVLKHASRSSIELIEFSPNGRWLLTGCAPSSYYIWDVASGTGRQLRMESGVNVEHARVVPIAAAFNLSSTCSALAPPKGMVKILETRGGEWSHGIPECGVGDSVGKLGWQTSQISFSPDENLVLTVPSSTCAVIEPPKCMVKVLETHGGAWGHVLPGCGVGRLGKLGWQTSQISFSPDENLVLTVPSRGTIPAQTVKIWDAHTGIELFSLEGHKKDVSIACFSPCGKYIASVSPDQTVRLWKTSDGSCVATLSEHNKWVEYFLFSPDGKILVSGDCDGSVIVRRMCDILPMDELEADA